MGKGVIVGGGDEGLYSVRLEHDRSTLDARKPWLESRISELDERLDELNEDLDAADADLSAASSAQDSALSAYAHEQTSENLEAWRQAHEAALRAATERNAVRMNMDLVTDQRSALQSELDTLNAIPDDPTVSAWCADLTENLSGEVGTIELPAGEGDQHVIIQPGHDGNATYSPQAHGILRHRESCTPAQAFHHAAMLPGWQRWQPTYRAGLVSNIDYDADTCTLTIDQAKSSAQALAVTPPGGPTYHGVPIHYMSCNAAAFEDGDRVVARFNGHNPDGVEVIGFESEPRDCGEVYVFSIDRHRPAALTGLSGVSRSDNQERITNYVFNALGANTGGYINNARVISRIAVRVGPDVYGVNTRLFNARDVMESESLEELESLLALHPVETIPQMDIAGFGYETSEGTNSPFGPYADLFPASVDLDNVSIHESITINDIEESPLTYRMTWTGVVIGVLQRPMIYLSTVTPDGYIDPSVNAVGLDIEHGNNDAIESFTLEYTVNLISGQQDKYHWQEPFGTGGSRVHQLSRLVPGNLQQVTVRMDREHESWLGTVTVDDLPEIDGKIPHQIIKVFTKDEDELPTQSTFVTNRIGLFAVRYRKINPQ